MPRTPTYGRATGPGDAVGSSIYEMYAPQRESTEFGVDYARTGYQLQKEVEIEKQKQLDAQIAQNQQVRDIQEQEEAKRRKKKRKGQKVASAATGITTGAALGAKYGSSLGLLGTVGGGLVGGLLGGIFGQEGGYVPGINPDSLLYKQYQAGGDVTGYSGGQPKFLRRGYQNLQLRQEDVGRAQENLDKMKSYGFWDAAQDLFKGYTAGKALAPGVEKFADYASLIGSGIGKEGGLTSAWDVIKDLEFGKSGTDLLKAPNQLPFEYDEYEWKPPERLSLPPINRAGGGYVPTPARKSIYRDQARATKYLK